MPVSKAQIAKLFPKAKPALLNAVVSGWPTAEAAGIETPERISQFLANIGTETGGLTDIEENLNYSAKRLTEVWPKRFPTLASAKPYANQPAKLANKVYGTRLGNKGGSDGWNYRGRGMMQTTGRDNYRALGFEDNPGALSDPTVAFATAVREWKKRGCNALADKRDTTAIRRKINGGTNGLDHVKQYLATARKIFADYRPAASKPVAKPTPAPARPALSPEAALLLLPEADTLMLRYPAPQQAWPSKRKLVFAVQSHLLSLKYAPGGLDGLEGPLTHEALIAAQSANGAKPTGAVDEATIKGVLAWPPRQLDAKRENAQPADVAAKVPEVQSNRRLKLGGLFTAIAAGLGTAFDGIVSNLGVAAGYLQPVKDAADDVPGWAWLSLVAAVSVGLFLVAQHGEKKGTEAFREGARR